MRDRFDGTRVDGAAAPHPDFAKRGVGGRERLGEGFADCVKERHLLHPAARKGVHREDLVNEGIGSERLLPGFDLFLFLGATRVAHLVQKHDDGLSDPGEDLHFRGNVARAVGALRYVHEIEHHARSVADVTHDALIEEEGLVGEAVPDFAQKPSDRVRAAAKTLGKAHGIAEARGVPENELAARGIAREHIVVRRLGDVRAVGHFSHVSGEKRARQRGLSDVGVTHEAQVYA